MIHTSRTVTVGKMESIINEPIVLYRGDREVEVEFILNGSKFMFTNGGNVIKSTNATHGQLVVNTPTGENMFSEVTECHEGKVVFVITKEMIDELIEVGFYSFQIRLFDESQVSRVTIPPVYQGIDIRNPIAAEDETDLVDIGLVDYSVVRKDYFENISTFLPNGDYNKTEWENKDVISADRLNKIEDALYEINRDMESTDKTLLNEFDNLNKNVDKQIHDFTQELEDEVEQFERDMTKQFGEFKVDIEADIGDRMDTIKADIGDRMDTIEADIGDRMDTIEADIEADIGDRMDTIEADIGEFKADIEADIGEFKADIGDRMDTIEADIGDRMDTIEAEVEGELDGLHAKDDEFSKKFDYLCEVRIDEFLEAGEITYDNAWSRAMTKLANGGRLLLPPKRMIFNNPVVCDVNGIEIVGVGDKTVLYFEASGLEIGNNNGVNRVFFRNFRITTKAGKIAGTIAMNFNKNKVSTNYVTDSVFENIHISNFDVGIQMYYCWCDEFRNVRIQPSNKCLSLQSQSNNIKFSRCSFCQYSEISDCSNLLGVSFYECSMEQSNVSFISLFQSYVTFVTPYVEFIPNLAELGFANEGGPSHLTILGGYGEFGIIVNGHRQMLSAINTKGQIRIDTKGWYSLRRPIIQNDNVAASYRTPVFEMRGNDRRTYTNNKLVLNRNGYLIFQNEAQEYFTSGSSYQLEEGKQYTLVYAVRGDGIMRMGKSDTSLNKPLRTKDEPFELNYSTFTHDGQTFSIAFFGQSGATLEVQYVAIYEGLYFEDVPLNNNGGYIGYARVYPTEGDWIVGDRIMNNNPTAGGYEGWICVESGTPGTWKGFGLIES